MIPNRNIHASLAFAYFTAESTLDDDESDSICSELFDKWASAWDEMGLCIDSPSDDE